MHLYLGCFTNIPSFCLVTTLNLKLGICVLVLVAETARPAQGYISVNSNLLFSDTARPAQGYISVNYNLLFSDTARPAQGYISVNYNLLFSDTVRPAAALAPAANPTSPTTQSLKILRFLPPPSPASPVRGPTTRTRALPLILPPTSPKRMRTVILMPPVLWTWARGVE